MKSDKILVIDDDQFVLESLGELLRSWGYEVIQSSNSKEGLSHTQENKLMTIILDIKLGDENGLDVLKMMRTSGVKTPVIVITAYPSEYTSNKFFDLEAVAFLRKPVQPANLSEILRMIQ